MWAQRLLDLEALHKENGSGPSPYFPSDGWTGHPGEVVSA
jgi:hypothetical protein